LLKPKTFRFPKNDICQCRHFYLRLSGHNKFLPFHILDPQPRCLSSEMRVKWRTTVDWV
jgi:hypothetical protein